ncbi:MAG: hypothetical protein JWN45_91 [Acidobacteriaceae bacterium]|nr:hypothetical protein [Acidobacteriaceae bacterium]
MKFGILTTVILAAICVSGQKATINLGVPPSAKEPAVFSEGVISTGSEFAITFTPDSRTAYFTRSNRTNKTLFIFESHYSDGKWQMPTPVSFSGKEWADLDPCLSPDGKKIYFISTRPRPGDTFDPKTRQMDIWMVEQTNGAWGTPTYIAGVSSDGKEGSPTVSKDGTLYFFSDRDAKPNNNSIYRSKWEHGKYSAPEKLGPEINSGDSNTSPYVTPDGKTLLFYSTREGGIGGGDLYASFFKHGKWTPSITLGAVVNSPEWDYNPSLSPDRKFLFFGRKPGFMIIPVAAVPALKDLH